MLRFFSFILLAVTVHAADSKSPPPALVADVDKLVAKKGFGPDEPGLAILINKPGQYVFSKGYGLSNLADGNVITPRTLFELASLSKPFTATAILMLQDRGLLSIEDDVRKTLPELPVYEAGNPIRIRDLLCHTSGLPEYFDFENVPQRRAGYRDNYDYLPVFARDAKDYPLNFRTGLKHEYTNSNYLLLGIIIERVSGTRYENFLRDEIFLPAGMKSTFVYQRPESVPAQEGSARLRAVGYEWRTRKQTWMPTWGTPPVRNEKDLIVGDGSIWSNLEDMAAWDNAVRSRKFLKPATWKLALQPGTNRKGKAFDYGLGWMTYYNDPKSVYGYGHDGCWGGFNTTYYRYLTEDHSIIILSNRGDTDVDILWDALAAIVTKHS